MIIGDRIVMLYTAYDGNIAQIAAASISLQDFTAGNYTNWQRDGLAFKNIWDKDAIIFPEKINGKYIIYHRIEPSIWVTYSNELKFPIWEKHAIIAGPRPTDVGLYEDRGWCPTPENPLWMAVDLSWC